MMYRKYLICFLNTVCCKVKSCVDIVHHPAVLHGEDMEVDQEVLLPEGDMGAVSEGGPRTRIMVVFWFVTFL